MLEDLTLECSDHPQAYLRLWNIYYLNKNKAKVLEIAGKLFIYGAGYSSIEIKYGLVLNPIIGSSLFCYMRRVFI